MWVFIWLSSVCLRCAADTNFLDAADVLKDDGVLALTDGSSYYVFKTNSTFSSFPISISGRCFDGTWTADPRYSRFTVEAKETWMNGFSATNEYRRIVFVVYRGRKKPAADRRMKYIFDGYFIIEELVKIPAPDVKR
jgi:hypothetical protein